MWLRKTCTKCGHEERQDKTMGKLHMRKLHSMSEQCAILHVYALGLIAAIAQGLHTHLLHCLMMYLANRNDSVYMQAAQK